MTAIAERAGVALDTVYFSVGMQPEGDLLRSASLSRPRPGTHPCSRTGRREVWRTTSATP